MATETDESKRLHVPPMPERPTRRPGMRLGAASLIAILVLGGGAGYLGGRMGASSGAADNTAAQRQSAFKEGELINTIAKDVSPSVVSVNVTSSSQQGGTDSGYEQFFGRQQQGRQQESAGTGIVLSKDGVIMTNRHVIPADTSEVSVTLSDGTELDDVEVVGRANENSGLDVAFLKVKDTKGKTLKAAKLGDSGKTQVGDRVVAIGNALGQFQNTVTSGIISGYGRSVQAGSSGGGSDTESLQDLFQTDAAINEGNSGGPLVNANSEVIGMNTAVAGNAQSIGFAIPVNDLQGLIRTVLRTGKFEQPYLGVRYVTLTDDIAEELKLSVKRGAYVLSSDDADGQETIIAGGPAAKAGVKEKDIIQAVNGKNIDDTRSLTALLAQYSVGETVELKVLRGDDTQTIRVKLEASPSS